MRLTNPFVYFEFCGWLADWLSDWLAAAAVAVARATPLRCTTFIRTTDLVYRASSSTISFPFLLSSFGGFAHTLIYAAFHSFIHSITNSRRFISLRRRFSVSFALLFSFYYYYYSLSPFLSFFSGIRFHLYALLPTCLAFMLRVVVAMAVAVVVSFITVFSSRLKYTPAVLLFYTLYSLIASSATHWNNTIRLSLAHCLADAWFCTNLCVRHTCVCVCFSYSSAITDE